MRPITICLTGNSKQSLAEMKLEPGWQGRGNEESSLVMTITAMEKDVAGSAREYKLSTIIDKGDARVIAAYLKNFADEV